MSGEQKNNQIAKSAWKRCIPSTNSNKFTKELGGSYIHAFENKKGHYSSLNEIPKPFLLHVQTKYKQANPIFNERIDENGPAWICFVMYKLSKNMIRTSDFLSVFYLFRLTKKLPNCTTRRRPFWIFINHSTHISASIATNSSLRGQFSSPAEVNKATEMSANFLLLNRALGILTCLGACSISLNSSRFSKSIAFGNPRVFLGALYAKCHCFAIKVCIFA